MKTYKPYFNRNTGTWEGTPAFESRSETITATVFDYDGDEHYIKVDYEVENERIVNVVYYDKTYPVALSDVKEDITYCIRDHERRNFDQINFL